MFITKKKYQEMQDLIEGYRDSRDAKQSEIYDLRLEKNHLENKIKILEQNNTALIDNNNKLTDWIEKIINEVGYYKVAEDFQMKIPIYKNECTIFGMKEGKPFTQKEIVLPQICFMKMEGK